MAPSPQPLAPHHTPRDIRAASLGSSKDSYDRPPHLPSHQCASHTATLHRVHQDTHDAVARNKQVDQHAQGRNLKQV